MASLQQLNDDIGSYLNRRDYQGPFPSWVLAVETELAETLRSKFQIASAYQNIDAAQIALPSNFASMESIRDATTGNNLALKDTWSGSWFPDQQDDRNWPASTLFQVQTSVCWAYRITANCIEFLPHPVIPDLPDPTWVPQQVLMNWYQKPVPLVNPADTNPILDNLYECYLFGILKRAGIWARETADDIGVWDAAYQQAVTRGNLWTQQSQFSGAPFTEELAVRW
jgi:hypothetical protein